MLLCRWAPSAAKQVHHAPQNGFPHRRAEIRWSIMAHEHKSTVVWHLNSMECLPALFWLFILSCNGTTVPPTGPCPRPHPSRYYIPLQPAGYTPPQHPGGEDPVGHQAWNEQDQEDRCQGAALLTRQATSQMPVVYLPVLYCCGPAPRIQELHYFDRVPLPDFDDYLAGFKANE